MNPLLRAFLLLLPLSLILVACASSPKKTAEEDLLSTLALLGDAVAAKDVNAIMDMLAPAFHHPEVGDKNDAHRTMTLVMESGFPGNFTLDYGVSETTLDDTKLNAIISPVTVKGADKSYKVSLSLSQNPDSGAWQIITFQILP